MILATIELPNGSRIDLDKEVNWTGVDTALTTRANAFVSSFDYEPKKTINRAFVVIGYATQVAVELGGKVIFVCEHPRPHLLRRAERNADSRESHERIASVEFSNGALLHLDAMNVWTGNSAVLVATANAYEPPGDVYRPDLAVCIAYEIAKLLGGKVIFVKKRRNKMPPDTIY